MVIDLIKTNRAILLRTPQEVIRSGIVLVSRSIECIVCLFGEEAVKSHGCVYCILPNLLGNFDEFIAINCFVIFKELGRIQRIFSLRTK